MISLFIDTSSERGVVALADGMDVICESLLPFGYKNSKYLMPVIKESFEKLQLDVNDLDIIVLGAGPGSYTGIRVGAAVAKTLSFVNKIPLVGINSLEGFVPNVDGCFAVFVDAKISGVYVLEGKCVSGQIDYYPAKVMPIDELKDILGRINYIVTPNDTQIKPRILDCFPNKLEWIVNGPNVGRVLKIAFQKFRKKEYSVNGDIDLIYMRKSQAEIVKN